MATKRKALTAPAMVGAPTSRDECASAIARLGELQRAMDQETAVMNERMAATTAEYSPRISALNDEIEQVQAGVQTWCEAHRTELLTDGRKSADLVTGEVGWRARPPSVVVRGLEAVIAALKASKKLRALLRVREEVNKEAVLAAPELVSAVKGITVVKGVEDFYVKPFAHAQ